VLRDDGVGYGDYVEQITYLIFLKMADERGRAGQQTKVPKEYNWASLAKKDGDDLELQYRHTLEELGKAGGMLGTIFRKAQNKIQDPAKLERLIKLIDKEQWSTLPADVKGEIYEGLLERNAQDVKGGAGQYFTPRPLIQAIVEVMQPKPTDVGADPACGTGGFLLAAGVLLPMMNSSPATKPTWIFSGSGTSRWKIRTTYHHRRYWHRRLSSN